MIEIRSETEYARVVEAFSDTVYRVAFQNTLHVHDAEDVTQEVFLKLLRYRGGFENETHLKAWLIRVTINRCRDLHRAVFRSREVSCADYDLLPQSVCAAGAEEMAEVTDALRKLKCLDRAIVCLHDVEGYSAKEIAALLHRNENTIASRLRRARKKLRKILEEEA